MNRIGPFSPPQTSTSTTSSDVTPAGGVAHPPAAASVVSPKPSRDEFVPYAQAGFSPLPWPGDAQQCKDGAPSIPASMLSSTLAHGGQPADTLWNSLVALTMAQASQPGCMLARGMSGPEVRDAQVLLRRAGFHVRTTSFYGPKTESAVLAFQKAHFKDAAQHTGRLDDATMQALRAAPAAGKALQEFRIKDAPDGTPMLTQGDARWGYDTMGDSGKSISSKGCFLTSMTMVLNQKLRQRDSKCALVTPREVNELLSKKGGFQNGKADLANARAAAIIEEAYGVKVPTTKLENEPLDSIPARLEAEIAAGRQVILFVDNDDKEGGNHFVVANRKGKNPGEYIVIDPAWGNEYTYRLDETGQFVATRPYHNDKVAPRVVGTRTEAPAPKPKKSVPVSPRSAS